jgi:hypothetical protein
MALMRGFEAVPSRNATIMRLELVSAALVLCSCTEPSVPNPKSSPTDSNAVTGAGAGGGGAAAGTGAPQATDTERRSRPPREDPDLDAGAGDESGGEATAPVARDAGRTGGPADASVVSDPQTDAATSPPTTGDGADDDVVGTWYGPNEDALGRRSTACVMLRQVGVMGPAGDTVYHGALECTGTLSFLETVGGVHSFEEAATSGAPCPSGTLRLKPLADGTLDFKFFWNTGDIPDGVGILNRVAVCP